MNIKAKSSKSKNTFSFLKMPIFPGKYIMGDFNYRPAAEVFQ